MNPVAKDYLLADKIFSAPATFIAGALAMADLPARAQPEIAFCGRSNVGKSSLLNALVGQNNLARVAKTPGRTQQLNLFNLGDRLILADMPGYGYAAAPEPVQMQWQKFLPEYLAGRDQLRRVFLLIDARHGIKDTDRQMLGLLLEMRASAQLVLTKCDSAKSPQVEEFLHYGRELATEFPNLVPAVVATSSKTGQGVRDLRAWAAEAISHAPTPAP